MRNVLATAAAAILVIGVTTAHGLPRRALPIPEQEPALLPWEAMTAQLNGVGPGSEGPPGVYTPEDIARLQVGADLAEACMQEPDCLHALSAYCEPCVDGSTACAHFECAADQCRVVMCPQ